MSNATNNEPLWTIEDVAGYLKLSLMTVQRLKSKGEIPFLTVGGSIRYRKEEIDEMLLRKRKEFVPVVVRTKGSNGNGS